MRRFRHPQAVKPEGFNCLGEATRFIQVIGKDCDVELHAPASWSARTAASVF